jgi:hypothetical protein
MLTRRQFLGTLPIGLTAAGAIEWGKRELVEDGRSRIGVSKHEDTSPGRDVAAATTSSPMFKVLHLCDNHLFFGTAQRNIPGAVDRQTLNDWRRYVDLFHPDLVVSNGDLWHDNPVPGSGNRALEFAAEQFSRLGVPWAFTWGNHDQLDDYEAGHALLESASRSLYRGGGTHGNYRVDVQRTNLAVAFRLFFLNTDVRGLTRRPLDWLKQTVQGMSGTPQALALFHIPIREHDLLIRTSPVSGIRLEDVTWENADDDAFLRLSESGIIRGCFCGHNHLNDYMASDSRLNLHFGRATGPGGYGGEQVRKGAKLIEIDLPTGTYTQATVFPDGSRWIGAKL